MKILDKITEIYCFRDDFLQLNRETANWRVSNNRQPRLTDTEVLTIALMESESGVKSLTQTDKMIQENFRFCLRHLCSYKRFITRLDKLLPRVEQLFVAAASHFQSAFYLIDVKAIAVCLPPRHWRAIGARVRVLREKMEHILGKSSKGWFFGFKLPVPETVEKKICNVI